MIKRLAVIVGLLVGGALAQTPPYNLQIAQQPLPIVNQVSVTYTGTQGSNTYYYWVVARYGVGNAAPSLSAIVTKADPSGSVKCRLEALQLIQPCIA